MLKDDLRAAIKAAMIEKDAVARTVLKVALGEIGTIEARTGKDLPDDEAFKIVRKLVKSNEETIEATQSEDTRKKLLRENEVLVVLLPQALGPDAIAAVLADVADAIKGAKADGPAMGIAMKTLKAAGAVVESKDVAAAVKQLRS